MKNENENICTFQHVLHNMPRVIERGGAFCTGVIDTYYELRLL